MALSKGAEKLLAWFNIYKITPGQYYNQLSHHPKAKGRGAFVTEFDELLVEYGYGY